jgi:hypothetical protein
MADCEHFSCWCELLLVGQNVDKFERWNEIRIHCRSCWHEIISKVTDLKIQITSNKSHSPLPTPTKRSRAAKYVLRSSVDKYPHRPFSPARSMVINPSWKIFFFLLLCMYGKEHYFRSNFLCRTPIYFRRRLVEKFIYIRPLLIFSHF